MTITLQAVNELIASLESAGELSIKETKVMALAKAYQQLAAENMALKNAITDHSHSVHFCEVCGKDDPCSTDDVCYALKDIPATDRIVAGIKADGVEEFAAYQRAITEEWACKEGHSSLLKVAERAELFAKQLREGADK
ncbi:hypothetical protein [Klebsiella pneumoniae]|uniref:hypothetical protein n=1 Tax=Klebsiella pneumoniae TaxID=573 RepID=UPI0029D4B84F|nr:hypothetical protein [Klebsiella pneumoniae]MDX6900664.1 hypothetical protein [Klebsiella pneumoniae]